MSKIIKRTFALALVFCMLLSVLPAVSAAEPTTQTYSFAKPSYATESAYVGVDSNLKDTYPDGANWYTLAAATDGYYLKYETNNILMNNIKNGGYWMAFVISVPTAGTYNLTAEIQTRGYSESENKDGFPSVDMHLLDPNATLADGTTYKAAIAALNGTKGSFTTSLFADYEKVVGGTIDGTLTHGSVTSYTTGYAYLGNCELKAQDYILLVDTRFAYTSTSKYLRFKNITLTPGEDGSAFVENVSKAAFSNWNNKTWKTAQVSQVYQLGADLYAPNATMYVGAQDLALNGNKLTVNTVTSGFIPGAATQLDAGVISGITGDGSVVTTGGSAPVLPNGGQQTISVKTAENTYEFFTPTLVSGQFFTGQSFMKDPTNTGFAFQLDVPDVVKTAIAKGNSGLEVSMDWSIGDVQGTTVQFSDADLVKWASGEGDTFYIEVANIGSLLQEYGEVNCTPAVGKDYVSFTGTDILYDGSKQDWDEDGVLKVLFIGNSFSQDTLMYSPQIFNNLGVEDVKMAYLYVGGCTLNKHLDYFTNNSASYTYYTSTTGSWSKTSSVTGYTALADENWDYICFQQARASSYNADTYSNLNALMDLVEAKCPQARYIWNMTWATDDAQTAYEMTDTEMYNSIVSAVKTQVLTNSRIEMVLPTGTAIQNARTSFMGSDTYTNTEGWKLTRDGYHLSENTGRYMAAITFAGKLMNLDVTKLTWKPSDVPADEARVAIESAANAIKTPYAVTQSEETVQDTIVAQGTVLDLEVEGETSWSATSSMKKYNFIEGDSRYSKYAGTLASTRSFTKEELPVGTVIEIAEGFMYRPEGWVGTSSGAYRSNEVTISKIVIDELWWGSYTNRGFNIAKIDGSTYASDPEGFQNALKITVPSN